MHVHIFWHTIAKQLRCPKMPLGNVTKRACTSHATGGDKKRKFAMSTAASSSDDSILLTRSDNPNDRVHGATVHEVYWWSGREGTYCPSLAIIVVQCHCTQGTNQALWASAGKSTWGRAGTPQVGLYHAQGDGVGTKSPTWTTPISGHDSNLTFASPVITRYPLMSQLGGLLL